MVRRAPVRTCSRITQKQTRPSETHGEFRRGTNRDDVDQFFGCAGDCWTRNRINGLGGGGGRDDGFTY